MRGDGANPFSEGRLCLRAQALTDLWKAPEGATEDGAGGDGGNGAGGNDAASEGATTASPGRLTSPRVRRAGSDAWEDISWDRALDEIATLVKDTRDATFEESIEGVEADDEAQGETDFDEWDWSDRGGYGDDGYGDNDYGARKRPRGVPVMRTRALGSFGGARLVAEEQFLLAKALRSWGVVNIDSEAAFGRRAFAAGVAATLGIAEPDGLWSDIANTGCLLTLGADVATSQPLSLRWIERARDAGALWIAVDPLRSASAEMADSSFKTYGISFHKPHRYIYTDYCNRKNLPEEIIQVFGKSLVYLVELHDMPEFVYTQMFQPIIRGILGRHGVKFTLPGCQGYIPIGNTSVGMHDDGYLFGV